MKMAAETELYPRRYPDDDASEINYLKYHYWRTIGNIDHWRYVQNHHLQWKGTVKQVEFRSLQETLDEDFRRREMAEREKLRLIENSFKYFGVRPPIDDNEDFTYGFGNDLPFAAGPSAAASGRVPLGNDKPNPEELPELRPWDFAEGPLQANVASNPYLIRPYLGQITLKSKYGFSVSMDDMDEDMDSLTNTLERTHLQGRTQIRVESLTDSDKFQLQHLTWDEYHHLRNSCSDTIAQRWNNYKLNPETLLQEFQSEIIVYQCIIADLMWSKWNNHRDQFDQATRLEQFIDVNKIHLTGWDHMWSLSKTEQWTRYWRDE